MRAIAATYLIETHGLVSQVSSSFYELTFYHPEDLIGKPIEKVFKELLHINISLGHEETGQVTFLFTKGLEPKGVNIHIDYDQELGTTIYNFIESPLLEPIMNNPFLTQLHLDNHLGFAIYESKTLTLLKANSGYLEVIGLPKSLSIGRMLSDLIPDFKGSLSEKMWKNILLTGETVYLSEFEGAVGGMKGKFWDNTLTPIKVDGDVKFIVSTLIDVSEKVLSRQLLEEKTAIIKKQKDQLEAIFENIHDGIRIYDKDGNIILSNSMGGRNKTLLGFDFKNSRELYEKYVPLDVEGETIPFCKMPSERVINGERFKNVHLTYILPNRTVHLQVNGTPLYDQEGHFLMGILVYDDVTLEIENEKLIKLQQQALLASEIEKNEALKDAIKMKDEFLYLMTHEFKTPLAVIYSALQTLELLCRNQMPQKADRLLNTIKQNMYRQLRLVNNLLDITRVSSGNIKMNLSTFNIIYLVQSIVDSIQEFAQKKGITVTFISKIKEKDVLIDEEKVERILLNLLSNALKFTPKGKSVRVILENRPLKNKNMISISIQDEGIGIPKDKKSHIFERFGQVNTSLSRQAEGTGMGLYLVKLYVQEMGGYILLESDEGQGSKFTVLLPINHGERKISNKDTEPGSKLIQKDDRLIEAISVEFSDIYV